MGEKGKGGEGEVQKGWEGSGDFNKSGSGAKRGGNKEEEIHYLSETTEDPRRVPVGKKSRSVASSSYTDILLLILTTREYISIVPV